MKVILENSKTRSVIFEELQVGDTFFDSDGDICIKIAKEYEPKTNAIFLSGGVWCETICEYGEKVTPANIFRI